ncbi:MAG: 2-C-methyl-D-erythritol 2,4-cyclodiphosphate synthase [Desulfobacterales bacterium]|jgi:2-C-methyl-D-erythritol 2,4-cyclodiphosphate synthase|nr:2-C-methyl-D-erythritol 2,4-cyclodiphosphate synthase [Desulfobacterales bacterium]
MRSGIGFDFHRLVEGRPLVLGGVHIPCSRGLLGHSDADALIHAVCDALLGAAGLGDIGLHFPDTDPRFQGASSLRLLATCRGLAAERGLTVVNVDAVILAEAPRMAPYRLLMQTNIAGALDLPADRVNIKATTMEACGPVGRGEGIGAMATVLLTAGEQGPAA